LHPWLLLKSLVLGRRETEEKVEAGGKVEVEVKVEAEVEIRAEVGSEDAVIPLGSNDVIGSFSVNSSRVYDQFCMALDGPVTG
jgi:hypothetical protein